MTGTCTTHAQTAHTKLRFQVVESILNEVLSPLLIVHAVHMWEVQTIFDRRVSWFAK